VKRLIKWKQAVQCHKNKERLAAHLSLFLEQLSSVLALQREDARQLGVLLLVISDWLPVDPSGQDTFVSNRDHEVEHSTGGLQPNAGQYTYLCLCGMPETHLIR